MVSGLLGAIAELLPAMESVEPSEKVEWQGPLEGWLCGGDQRGGLETLVKSRTVLRAWQN